MSAFAQLSQLVTKKAGRFTLIRRDRDHDWRQSVFTLLADYLRTHGVGVCIENRTSFRTCGLPFRRGDAVEIRDSVAVLQNDFTKTYCVLDCHDWTRPWDLDCFQRDLWCRMILKCQHRSSDLLGSRCHIVRPWTYFDCNWPYRQDELVALRGCERRLNGLFFRGHLWEIRQAVVETLHQRNVLSSDHSKIAYEKYLLELGSHRVLLSLPGMGEFCHRDVEAFAAGIPVLRPKLRNRFHDNLVGDFHYVSVDTDFDRDPPELIAARIEERYQQVAGQADYLAYVARNAAAWYDRNVLFPQSLELTARLLGFFGKPLPPS